MEFYYFYNVANMLSSWFVKETHTMLLLSVGLGLALWIALFLVQGVGIYQMAKHRGFKNKGLAFVPFANLWYISKLTGDGQFFGHRMKRTGMYAVITQVLATVVTFVMIFARSYLWWQHGVPEVDSEMGTLFWPGLTGVSLSIYKVYEISFYLLSIFQLIFEIFLVILFMGLYKKYSPKNQFALSMLTLFVPMSRFIIPFVLRHRKAVDYEAYVRARQEAYMRQQRQYQSQYGNPYGGPYQNPYGNPYQNPYGQSGYQKPTPPEEPFAEFSSGSKQTNSHNSADDPDGFFN
ncbi:MAG: hypothetical protein IJW96_01530 [Clostridia bacterium]|nr:hypothetical protein [Clostridia bacterium]